MAGFLLPKKKVKRIYIFFFFFIQYSISQAQTSFPYLQAVRQDGVLRSAWQPSAILLPNGNRDWALLGINTQLHGNLFLHYFPLTIQQNPRNIKSNYAQTIQNTLQGPIVSFPINPVSAIAVGVRFSQHINLYSTPTLGNDIKSNFSQEEKYGNEIIGQQLQLNSMIWYETDVTYARVIAQTSLGSWRAGATIRLLAGTSGVQLSIPNFSYKLNSYNSVTIRDLSLRADYSNQLENPFQMSWLYRPQGVGSAVDLGVSWRRNKENKFTSSFWQIDQAGISLTGLGGVRFGNSTRFTSKTADRTDQTSVMNFKETYRKINTLTDLQNNLSHSIPIDSEQSSFFMTLPIVLRSEVFLSHRKWGLYSAVKLDLSRWQDTDYHLKVPSSITLVPNYQIKYWKIGLPLYLESFARAGYGITVSRKHITFGTDHLGSIILPQRGSQSLGFFVVWHRSLFTIPTVKCPAPTQFIN